MEGWCTVYSEENERETHRCSDLLLCHIRTMGSAWNLACILCLEGTQKDLNGVTKYGATPVSLLRQIGIHWDISRMFTHQQ